MKPFLMIPKISAIFFAKIQPKSHFWWSDDLPPGCSVIDMILSTLSIGVVLFRENA